MKKLLASVIVISLFLVGCGSSKAQTSNSSQPQQQPQSQQPSQTSQAKQQSQGVTKGVGPATVNLTWLGFDTDITGTKNKPDGKKDAHFKLSINVTEKVKMGSTESYDKTFDKTTGHWMILFLKDGWNENFQRQDNTAYAVVYDNGQMLTDVDGNGFVLDPGQHNFDFYLESSDKFNENSDLKGHKPEIGFDFTRMDGQIFPISIVYPL